MAARCTLSVVLLVAFLPVIFSQTTVWTDDFKQDIPNDVALDSAFTVDVKWDGSSGIIPTVDPLTVDPVLLDIAGDWPFDSQNSGSPPTTPDVSAVPVDAQVQGGATWLPSGGKFGGAYQFSSSTSPSDYLFISPSPLTDQMALIFGFSMSLWVKLPSQGQHAPLFERIYNAFEMDVSGSNFKCTVRDSTGRFFTVTGSANYTTNQWTHLACTWDPLSNSLSLYVGGQLDSKASANLTQGLYFSDGSNLGIGNRPLQGAAGVNGVIDEVIFYKKTLTASNVLSLSQRSSAVVPFPGPSFRSSLIKWNGTTANYWDVSPSWLISGGQTTDVYVEISTNRGTTWCNVSSGAPLGLERPCRLPAANFMFRVTFFKKVTIDSITFQLLEDEPDRDWPSAFTLGINRGASSYYATHWVWLDVQKTASWSVDDRASYDSNFYPLGVNVTNSPTWLMAAPNGPEGNYTVFGDGTGAIGLARPGHNWKDPVTKVILPNAVGTAIPQPWQVGMYYTDTTDPISKISIVMPGFESNYTTNPFHPYYLERFQGVNTIRFMDMMATNGNQLAKWSDRTLPTWFSQSTSITRYAAIASLTDASSTHTNFSGYWKALVTTTGPHPFSTGQLVQLANTSASVAYTSQGSPQTTINFDGKTAIIEVVSETSFYWRYSDSGSWAPDTKSNNTITTFTGSTTGSAQVTIESGTAIEHLIEMAVTQDADPWFNIPTLADDDYITQFGRLIYNQLPSNRKAYVEYGNELWNWGFSQQRFTVLMGNSYQGGAAAFVAARVARIYAILGEIFGSSASSRLVKVMPAFSGGSHWGDDLLTWMNDTTINPTGVKMQAMAIAPYFGLNVGGLLCGNNELINSTDEDQILDWLRDDMYGLTAQISSNHAVAQKHGVALIAYEGGQSLVNDLACSNPNGNWYNAHTRDLLNNANRHPRMKDIYRQFFWIWATNGGELMCHFNDYGGYSQWGSWGLLETQTQPTSISYKYQAFMQTVSAQNFQMSSGASRTSFLWLLIRVAAQALSIAL